MGLPKLFEPIQNRLLELTDITTLQKEASFALQHIDKNKLLKESTQESKQKALLNVIQIGLTFNPVAKECYLVPRWNGQLKKNECHSEPSYIGLVKLLTDSGSIIKINTQIVYEGDDIDIDMGECRVNHKPYVFTKKEKGDILGVYAIATLPNNVKQIEFMSKDELYDIRDRSESYKAFKANKIRSAIWVNDETEMMRKTIIRRIYKYLPRTAKMQKVDNAIDLDNNDYKLSLPKIGFIESLIDSAKLKDQEKEDLRLQIDTLNNQSADKMIKYLQSMQPDFRDGDSSNKAINEELDNKVNNPRA